MMAGDLQLAVYLRSVFEISVNRILHLLNPDLLQSYGPISIWLSKEMKKKKFVF